MKKILKALLFSLILVFGLTTSVFAAGNCSTSCSSNNGCSSSALESNLAALGLDRDEVQNVVDYLQTFRMSDAQEHQLLGYVDQAFNVAGGVTNLNTLTGSQKAQLVTIAQNAAGVVGLSVYYTKGFLRLSGLLTLTNADAENVQWGTLRTAITNGKLFSQCVASAGKTGSGTYVPRKGGGYCKTATNTGNLLLAGFGLMAVSGVLIIKRRKALKA